MNAEQQRQLAYLAGLTACLIWGTTYLEFASAWSRCPALIGGLRSTIADIAVALGVVLLGEPFTSRMMLAAALVLAGVTVLRRVRPVATTPTANPRGEETPSARRIAWRAAENYRRGRPFTRLPFRMRNSVSCGVAIVRRFGR